MINQHKAPNGKQHLFLPFCLLTIAAFWLTACSHSKFSDYEKTPSGLRYKFQVKGKDTIHPKYGEVVKVKMAKCLDDSILESTNLLSPDGIDQYLREPGFKGAIEEGIRLMTVGDSATFLISTDSVNKYFPARDSSKNFKKNNFLAFGIKLMQIKTVAEKQQEENQKRQAYIQDRKGKGPQELNLYIQDNHIDVKPTGTGLYLVEKEKGKGVSPKAGDSVIFHYTGSFLDGTIFDSSVKRNEPFGFTIGTNHVIPGWEEALRLMKKGEVATIIIPSSLAYDSAGYINPKSGKYFIPPYCPMKFDIQLLDIKQKK